MSGELIWLLTVVIALSGWVLTMYSPIPLWIGLPGIVIAVALIERCRR